MKLLHKSIVIAAVILLSILISLSTFLLPSPQPQSAILGEFSAERAMMHVKRIASRTHPVGSAAQKEVCKYIVDELVAMGFEPEIQTGHGENDVEGFMGFVPFSGELENIYFRLEGSGDTDQDILMLAHYDSTLGGPGAADDASGVATLLETARALKLTTPLINDMIFLLADGEEAGLLGSKLFVENTDVLQNVCMVMNFESRGNRGPSVLFETSDKNEWLMKEYAQAVPYPVGYSFTDDVYKIVQNVTDFTPFKNIGKSGLNFANLDGMEIYHNPQDTPENLDRGFLQHQGSYALSLARHFGNVKLDNVKSNNNAVYFTLAGSVMVLYSEQWTIPLAVLTLLFLLAVIIIGLRRGLLSLRGIVSGFFASLLSIIAVILFGIAAQVLFSSIYYKLENVLSLSDLTDLRRTLIVQGNTWIIGSLTLSLIILLLLQRIFSRKISDCNILVGNTVIWSILAVFSAFYLPGAGYMFLWPLLLSLGGLLLDLILCKGTTPTYLALVILSTVTCILIFIPVVYLLYQALTMLGAGIPIAILSIPASLILSTASIFIGKNKVASVGSVSPPAP